MYFSRKALLRFFTLGIFITSFITLSSTVSAAVTWNAVIDDTFGRADTSTGTAGSTTGVGNGWIDVAGGVWNLGSGKLQGFSNTSSDYLTKFLVRPSTENTQNQREVVTIPAGENLGQFIGVILRYQSSTGNHYLAHISASGIYLYKVVGGSVTLVNSTMMSISNAHSYSVDFSATGINSTALSVVVTDLTASTQLGTTSGTDSEASLQTSGAAGLSTWYNSGTTTTHISRVQTFSTNLSLSGSSSATGTVSTAIPITDLQIIGNSASTTPVKLRVTSGTLAMSTVTGLTFTGGQTGSTLYFSGTVSDINTALATLTYTGNSVTTDTLEVSLVDSGQVFFTDTGHLYEYISSTLTWTAAKAAAEALSKYGATGYLTTITSQAENDFVSARLTNAGWMGASDAAVEGAWKWVTGPENGTQFWSGASGGSTVGGNYANWNNGEPNDSGGNEDCGQFLSGGSGKWNDLPCSGTTLPGYVVEYGATGSLPTVVAKNITLNITDAPAVSSFSPADNATNVATSTNLVITFNRNVSTSTGSITIRKTSDDTLVETIPVSSSIITGNGTSVITIDPNSSLAESTGYYVMIPSTAFKDGSNAFYSGTTASSTWNFTTGDFTPPVITSLASSTATTTASITWITDELASTRAYFGPSTAYGSSTALLDTSPRVLSHSISLSGLLACTTYYFQVVSTDASSNTSTSTAKTFNTSGCNGSITPITATSTVVTVSSASTSTLSQGSTTLSVVTPSNFTATSSSIVIQIQSLAGTTTLNVLGSPSGSLNAVGSIVFDVKAIIDSQTVLDSFNSPVTIRYQYTDSDISGLNESTLRLYHYHSGVWSALNDCTVDAANNIITCTTPSFSIFSLFGQASVSPTIMSGGIPYGCTDPTSLNYNPYVMNKDSLCQYATQKTPVVVASSTPVVTQIVAATSTIKKSSPKFQFTKSFRLNANNDEVKKLQEFLNTHGFPVATKGAGSLGKETTLFGDKTKAALIAFQEAHTDTVLIPQNLTKGTGHFLSYTRSVVNSILASE